MTTTRAFTLAATLTLVSSATAQTPFLKAATYFGGAGHESASAFDFAPDGTVYLVGRAGAPAFTPMPNALNTLSGGMDIFVVKMTSDFSDVIWSRYVGGTGQFDHIEYAADCAATADGGVVVIGRTEAPDFPTVSAIDSTLGGTRDHVLFKLDANGNVVFSTYLGGSGDDGGDSDDDNYGEVEIAPDGSIFVAGFTRSADLPLVSPIDSTFGGFQADVFVMKLSADGQTVHASTYLGDEFRDQVFGMRIDPQGRPVITGDAGPNWPYTPGAYSFGTPSSSGIVYVTTLAADAQSIAWSARLDRVDATGGHLTFNELAIADSGVITVVGNASGNGFPVPDNAYQPDLTGGQAIHDAIALQFSPDGSAIVGGTYHGAFNAEESSLAVGIDSFGNVLMNETRVLFDAALVRLHKFSPDMTALHVSTELAGSSVGLPLRVDENNNVVTLLDTYWAQTTPGAFQEAAPAYPGPADAYIARWDMQDPPVTQVTGDITNDGLVNVDDLLGVINAWGACQQSQACPADVAPATNGDGAVNVDDLLMVINNWS